MTQDSEPYVEPLLTPAEGEREEEADEYARAQEHLAEQPLMEPAEGAPDDVNEPEQSAG